ncbi:MAG: 3'-5' exonuclease, partial [Ghiorsea sp.]
AWHVLQALFLVLRMLAGQLWQVFEQHKKVDFVEVMLRAKQALGQENAVGEIIPSEALLRLDYQIKHILVDEFQDTSTLQIDLLSRLTAGWVDGDGRSLFMVGDPMQSIYRFRKAEVSLFLKAAQNQLPNHQALPEITSLTLQQNFRSSPDIVNWVNRTFASILPEHDDALAGAIAYAPSQAFKSDVGMVNMHVFKGRDDAREAEHILNIIQEVRPQGKSIGMLARNRSHLKEIMRLLQQENIPFRALDMLSLAKQPEIIDLRSLTCALLHPCDHVAWASLLRAPSTGLSLEGLYHIFNTQPDSAWQAIQDYAQTTVNQEEQHHLNAFIQALTPAIAQRGKVGWRALVESTWLRLASAATLSPSQLANTDVYFDLLQALEEDGNLQIARLDQRLAKLFAKPENQPQAEQIELMTMHGAKGLQWDTVILPGLGKTPRAKDKDVLIQTEVHTHGKRQILLSPLPQHSQDKQQAKTYNLIRDFEKQRDALEIARLLYVACTRAESALYLFGHTDGKEETGFTPASSSLLALLWQDDETCFDAHIHIHDAVAEKAYHALGKSEQDQHLPMSFQALAPQPSIHPTSQEQPLATTAHQPEFSWAGASAKAVGIALHAALQHIAEIGFELCNHERSKQLMPMMQGILVKEGISQAHLAQAMQRCQKALNISLNSSKAQWILSQQHPEQHNEWALTYIENKRCKHIVLDRSFIDQDGIRWVIDYKTGGHEGAGLDAFLDQELIRYTQDTPQLPNYVKALQALEPERTIKAALYFPMVDGWRVWQ